jgi:hypothetical protein
MRENEPAKSDDAPGVRNQREVSTRELVKHLAITERAMVKTVNSGDRLQDIMNGCQVGERRARRLIKAVNMLWHYRAQAFGTPGKARTKILPKVQALFEAAYAEGKYTAALGALKLESELCGLGRQDAPGLPLGDQVPAQVDDRTEEVAQQVMDRLLAFGMNGRGLNGGNGRGRPEA